MKHNDLLHIKSTRLKGVEGMTTQQLTCPYCGKVWTDDADHDVNQEGDFDGLANDIEHGVCPDCISLHLLL